jgi:hypothetical protein
VLNDSRIKAAERDLHEENAEATQAMSEPLEGGK